MKTTGPDQKPESIRMGGSLHFWERSTSPWHRDAFPAEYKDQAPDQGENPTNGWLGLDWCKNPIVFIPDGTTIYEEGDTFPRPSTRGELAELLKEGKHCEVAAQAVEMTKIILEAWLDTPTRVQNSPNKGWVVFSAIT